MNKDTEHILKMVKSDGLLGAVSQVKLTKKTLSSIHSFWKRYPGKPEAAFNGLPYDLVSAFDPDCPYIYTEVQGGFKLCLWADLETRLSKLPTQVHSSIKIMADFQRWLYDANRKNIRDKICEMMTSCLSKKKIKK